MLRWDLLNAVSLDQILGNMMILGRLSYGTTQKPVVVEKRLNGFWLHSARIVMDLLKSRSHDCVFSDHEIENACYPDVTTPPDSSSPVLAGVSNGLSLRIASGFRIMAICRWMIAGAMRSDTGNWWAK